MTIKKNELKGILAYAEETANNLESGLVSKAKASLKIVIGALQRLCDDTESKDVVELFDEDMNDSLQKAIARITEINSDDVELFESVS